MNPSPHKNTLRNSIAIIGGATLIIALSMAGCGSSEAAQTAPLRFLVAATPGLALHHAEEEWTDIATRWSTAAQHELTATVVPSNDIASQLFAAGHGDMCRLPAHLAAYHLRSGTAEIIGIASRNGSTSGRLQVVVEQNSPITSLSALRGNSLAFSQLDSSLAIPGALALFASEDIHLVNDLSRIVPVRSNTAIHDALLRNKVDAALIYSPDTNGKEETLFAPSDFRMLDQHLDIPNDLLIARKGRLDHKQRSTLLASLASIMADPSPPRRKTPTAWAEIDSFVSPSSPKKLNDTLKILAQFQPEQLSALEEFSGP